MNLVSIMLERQYGCEGLSEIGKAMERIMATLEQIKSENIRSLEDLNRLLTDIEFPRRN